MSAVELSKSQCRRLIQAFTRGRKYEDGKKSLPLVEAVIARYRIRIYTFLAIGNKKNSKKRMVKVLRLSRDLREAIDQLKDHERKLLIHFANDQFNNIRIDSQSFKIIGMIYQGARTSSEALARKRNFERDATSRLINELDQVWQDQWGVWGKNPTSEREMKDFRNFARLAADFANKKPLSNNLFKSAIEKSREGPSEMSDETDEQNF